jgi:hypothetical protein
MSNWPPINILVRELMNRGLNHQANIIARTHGIL